MSDDFSPALRRELLDDFYAECDELLVAFRTGLSQLEAATGDELQRTKIVEALFRNAHSLKGSLAIVGLRSGEDLAHGMEDLLGAISKRLVPVTAGLVDQLLAGSHRLEEIVVAYRSGAPSPETQNLLAHLRSYPSTPAVPHIAADPAPPAPAPAARLIDPEEAARSRGLSIFKVSFSPSKTMDARGVNVAAVRKRLGAIGEIISASPKVYGSGVIVFEFVVGLRELPDDLAMWAHDGVVFQSMPLASHETAASSDVKTPGQAEERTETLSLAPSHLVRVDLARLDDLMRITGEMVVHRSRLEERIKKMGGDDLELKEVNLALTRSLREMREAITHARMVPIGELFSRMPFVVRELMRGSPKSVRIEISGNQTEIDKFVVERLKEPLLHLVRNAFAHGIESSEARTAAGKPGEGTITLKASSAGEFVIIEIADDGRGIDAAAVARRAAELGIATPAEFDAAAILEVLCVPGFSTKEEVDLASGRGVGMAVVATTIRELDGSVKLETTAGRGTRFTVKIPLSLSIANAIIVGVGQEICAVLQNAVNEVIQTPTADIRTVGQKEFVPSRGKLLPMVRLQTMFRTPARTEALVTLLVVDTERGEIGLAVDQLLSQREIVIRPLVDPLLRVHGISGATELGDGRPILILNPSELTHTVAQPGKTVSPVPLPSQARAS